MAGRAGSRADAVELSGVDGSAPTCRSGSVASQEHVSRDHEP